MDADNKRKFKPHPRATANPLSIVTFSWLFGLFQKGFKRDLDVDDLYTALDEHQSSYLGNKLEKLWNQELEQSKVKGKDPSLMRVLLKGFGPQAMLAGVGIAIFEMLFKVTQPLFVGGLIRYFSPGSKVTLEMAFLNVVAIVVCCIANVVSRQSYMMAMFHLGMKIRIAVCSLIYRKALRLTMSSLRETTVGQSVNLLSNDVNRFDHSLVFVVYLWLGPLQTLILLYLMWREIEYAALVGIATIILIIPVQASFGRMLSTLRLRVAKRTDARLRFMNEIIVGIQVIKMYAWEKPFAYLISLTRKREISSVRCACYVRGLLLSFEKFSAKIAIFVSIVTYAAIGNKITAEKMFVITGFVNILIKSMTDYFPRSVAQISESLVSVKRIQKFLMYEEVAKPTALRLPDTTGNENGTVVLQTDLKDKLKTDVAQIKVGIKVNNISAKWGEDVNENALTNVSLEVKPGDLVAVIGPVGSGKTSLLHAILKELSLNSGSIIVGGTISYSSQEPWLFTGSVKQNILFGQPLNRDRYRKVVRVCALERDFELLPHGDKTIVGDRGATLSGGQRARINLARAVYKEADVYLLDDPLSAVDTHVGRHLFEDCICEFLKDKTRILVTHQLQYLKHVDNILILHSGLVEAAGTFDQLHHMDLDFAKQLDIEAGGDDDDPHSLAHGDSKSTIASSKRKGSESSEQSANIGEPIKVSEMRSRGHVSVGVYTKYCTAGGNCCITMIVIFIAVLSQAVISVGDYWMSFWTNVEERRPAETGEIISNSTESPDGGWSELIHYNGTELGRNVTEFGWMPSTETCIYIYTGFIAAIIVLTLMSSFSFFTMCMRASISLHNKMFNSIIRATMLFFNNNPSGQILNRFSKDMGSIDEVLPQTFQDCVQRMLMILGVVVVIAVVNYWLLIPTVVMLILFYLLRVYYGATSRSIKRLEGVTRSPVFSHLNASLQGLTTIRAYGAQSMLEKEFDNHQDLHTTSYYLFVAANRAFGLWLDGICCLYIALVSLNFLVLGGEKYGGDVGLAITQATSLTGMLQWGIRQVAELENQMTSVERVLEYTTVEQEPPAESPPGKKPSKDWPSKGVIVFARVFLSYSKNEPAVLKNVNFMIQSAEKIGIVGRTGAGKSSLITALFRLVDLSGGSIKIDEIDIAYIGLHDLRSKISIIPQEPALFSGLLRENLDPFEQYSDAVLWSALEEVELKQAVEELPSGLSHKVSEGGSNFSVGQRQLLCLARAIIRNNKILVMDEATANVDPQTDELIQATIRRKFADCTVLTIAHRLHTIIDSDRIIVMDAGSVVEFDHPYILLKNEDGYFYKMVQETGHAMAESLFKTVQTKYESHGGEG